MKSLAAAATLAVVAALPVQAQPGVPPGTGSTGPVCLHPFDSPDDPIQRTKVIDPQTILFYMRDGKVWKNVLKTPCRGLMFHGFSFVTHYDSICSNSVSISVIKSGETCELGIFTPYTPPPAAP